MSCESDTQHSSLISWKWPLLAASHSSDDNNYFLCSAEFCITATLQQRSYPTLPISLENETGSEYKVTKCKCHSNII